MRTFAPGLFALAVLVGCGPSFQAVHEGEARFEHCYALDDSASAPLEKKAECWNDWAQHYTYGQTRDRVQYATQRYLALSRVPSLPTDEAMMSAAPGEGVTVNSITAPAPTSAFAPPPKTMESVPGNDAGAPRSPDAGSAPAAPLRSPPKSGAVLCAEDCESTWTACRGDCEAKRCAECDRVYKTCLRTCAK
jgi:hypothetical protein